MQMVGGILTLDREVMVGTRARVYRHMTFVRVMDVPRGARPYHPLGQKHLPQTGKSPSHSATAELLNS